MFTWNANGKSDHVIVIFPAIFRVCRLPLAACRLPFFVKVGIFTFTVDVEFSSRFPSLFFVEKRASKQISSKSNNEELGFTT